MEGTLLTVEETVESAPASTPTPRRRAPRARAAAKATAESPENEGAAPDTGATLETFSESSFAQSEEAPQSSSAAVAPAETEASVTTDPTAVPDGPISDSAAEVSAIAATVWESPPIERSAEPAGDGRGELNHRNRTRDGRGRRDRGPRPAPGERSNGAERFAGDGRGTLRHTPRSQRPRGPVHLI